MAVPEVVTSAGSPKPGSTGRSILMRIAELRAWLFLAMACHKNGDPDAASKWFGQAVRWADEHPKWTDTHPVYRDQFPRFRAEAAEVLAGPPGPKPKPK